MHAARTPMVFAILLLATGSFAGSKFRPHASPIASGNNIDLVDVLETGTVSAAIVSGSYAYASYGAALVVIDISNLGLPTRSAVAFLPSSWEAFENSEGYLYCYTGQSVQIVDVTTPSSPTVVGSIATVGNRLDVDGNRLYIKNDLLGSALQIYDLTNPVAPALLGTSAFPVGTEFEARNQYVYSGSSDGLQIIDATNPANPVLAGSVPTGMGVHNLDVRLPYAYVVSSGFSALGLYIIDVSNPAAPTQVGFYPTPPPGPPNFEFYEDVAVTGNTVYVSGGPSPLRVFDVSNPAMPVQLASVPTCGGPDGSVRVDGNRVVIESNQSVCILDCSNPTSPTPHANYVALPTPAGLALSPTHIVMSAPAGSLSLVDRNDTQERSYYGGGLESEINTFGAVVQDDYAYILNASFVTGVGDMTVFDISNPATPVPAGIAGLAIYPSGLLLGSNHAYSWSFNELLSIDISDPADPAVVAQVPAPFSPRFALAEPYLYGITGSNGFVVFSVSNPAAPAQVGAGLSEAALGGDPLQVATSGGYAYVLVGGASGGLRVVDVTNPLLPAVVGNLPVTSPNFGGSALTARDSFAYFAGQDGILRVADVSNPSLPVEIGNIPAVGISVLEADPPSVYGIGYGGHVLQYQHDLPTSVDTPRNSALILEQNVPNPFNPSTSISFQLPSSSRAVVEIFDVRGGLVRTLVNERMSAGPHTVEWNGRDDSGSVAGSGVYFYRLTAGRRSEAKKMVILK